MPGWLLLTLIITGLAVAGIAGLMYLSHTTVRRSGGDPFVAGADLTVVANCLGSEGLGRNLQGTGTLALFADEVRFMVSTTRAQLAIPRRKLAVTLEQYPNPGDYRPGDKPALVLRWTEDGRRCTIGLRVPDPTEWRDLLLR